MTITSASRTKKQGKDTKFHCEIKGKGKQHAFNTAAPRQQVEARDLLDYVKRFVGDLEK